MQRPNVRDRRQAGPQNNGLRRSIAYLSKLGWQAVLPYLFLIVATLSQLAVPRLVRDSLDAVERGTHNELLARRGAYYDLYMSQFRRDEA